MFVQSVRIAPGDGVQERPDLIQPIPYHNRTLIADEGRVPEMTDDE
jgi:hypothetical protein